MRKCFLSTFVVVVLALSLPLHAQKEHVDTCREIHLADVGWTDISATTAVAGVILEALSYEPKISVLSVPVTFASLKSRDVDVFLGNWSPSQDANIEPYLKDKSITRLSKNLEGAKYTLAVPRYVYEGGVHHVKDLSKYKDRFEGRIFGIEAGNEGNGNILKMIKTNDFGLGGFELVASSEQGMLIAVDQAVKNNEWIAFLGWAPHPMNVNFDVEYLEGTDDYFGPNYGSSSVYTVARSNFASQCPNLTAFFTNLRFSVDMENELMGLILDQGFSPKRAARKWLASHSNALEPWLLGVTSIDGHDGLSFAKNNLGLNRQALPSQFSTKIPIGSVVESFVLYLTTNFSRQFRAVSNALEWLIEGTIDVLQAFSPMMFIFMFCLFAFLWHRSFKLVCFIAAGFLLIWNLGYYEKTIETLVLVLYASLFSVIFGVPIGILAARRPLFYAAIRPMLDLAQTIPTFVYLIPTLMLFGLGVVPGLLSTIVFAIPAPIRLTYLGIKGVPRELIEAGQAFGSTRLQQLMKIEIPHALPSIMAGVTQCIMLSLSMVVIAALVGADGLGTPVVRALNTVNIRQGFEAGLAIVIVAIILDRTLRYKQTTTSA